MRQLLTKETIEQWLLIAMEAQARARVALFIASLISAAILLAEWNSYMSWDRQWAEIKSEPVPWGQKQLLDQQIRSWLETNAVNLAVVGLRVSVSDAAVIGSITLLMASFYVCMTAKRENAEIGMLLRAVIGYDDDIKARVLTRIRATAVFSLGYDQGAIVDSLSGHVSTAKMPSAKYMHMLFTYLPAIAISIIVISDLYYASLYQSPWTGSQRPSFRHLSLLYRGQLIAMDVLAVALGAWVLHLCRRAQRYQRATSSVVEQFERASEEVGARAATS
jgi:hypothetical protein